MTHVMSMFQWIYLDERVSGKMACKNLELNKNLTVNFWILNIFKKNSKL